ncbi:hypothetical protein [Helicobacter sp. 23-1045]
MDFTLTREKNEMIFSLIFFFFASFLFAGIITSTAIPNFDNLLPIMLKPNGFFVTMCRILLVVGFLLALYHFFTRKNFRVRSRLYGDWTLGASVVFTALFALSILSNYSADELDKMMNIYSYDEPSELIRNIKKTIIDSVVFIFFILMPIISFFYKQRAYDRYFKRVYDSYFYQTYLREVSPSMNTSIFFLFGYSVESYSFTMRPIIDCALSVICILLFVRIAISLRKSISFYSVMNLVILIIGFGLFLYSAEVLSRGNFYYVGIFFYTIGLLYWYINIAIRLRG